MDPSQWAVNVSLRVVTSALTNTFSAICKLFSLRARDQFMPVYRCVKEMKQREAKAKGVKIMQTWFTDGETAFMTCFYENISTNKTAKMSLRYCKRMFALLLLTGRSRTHLFYFDLFLSALNLPPHPLLPSLPPAGGLCAEGGLAQGAREAQRCHPFIGYFGIHTTQTLQLPQQSLPTWILTHWRSLPIVTHLLASLD